MSSEGESTYKVLHRILGIHEYLSKQRYPSLSVLAERFGVSTKTIQRDVSFMKKEMNLPIRNYRDLGGYGYTEEVIDMPAMKLSRQEIFALLVAQSSIEQYQGSAFADPLKSFFTKLIGHLAPLDLSKMRDINRYVTYLPNGVNTTSYETLETCPTAEIKDPSKLPIMPQRPGKKETVSFIPGISSIMRETGTFWHPMKKPKTLPAFTWQEWERKWSWVPDSQLGKTSISKKSVRMLLVRSLERRGIRLI